MFEQIIEERIDITIVLFEVSVTKVHTCNAIISAVKILALPKKGGGRGGCQDIFGGFDYFQKSENFSPENYFCKN